MNETIKTLLRLNLEVEGALRVLYARQTEDAKALVIEKIETFTAVAHELLDDIEVKPEAEEIIITGFAAVANTEKITEEAPTENIEENVETPEAPKEDIPAESQPQPETDKKEAETPVYDDIDLSEGLMAIVCDDDEEQETPEEDDDDDYDVDEPEPAPEVDNSEPQEQVDEKPAADKDKPEITGNPFVQETDIVEKEFVMIPEDENTTPPAFADVDHKKDQRLEDVIAMKEAKSLASVFTINDRFRFTRELFGNDRYAFDETVEMLDKCTNLGEAYDYLLNERELDVDNEVVKEFINVVANYLNAQ